MTRREVVETIDRVRQECISLGAIAQSEDLSKVLDAFRAMTSTAASILGSAGGRIGGKATSEGKAAANRAKANLPPGEGKMPRGRPRKSS